MTIPQIISSVGFFLLIFGFGGGILHCVNLLIPGVDFIIPSSAFPVVGLLITVPAALLGIVLGIAGFFGEWIEEWWINQQRRN